MTIDWQTPLASIDGDISNTATQIRNKVLALGGVYDQELGGIESAEHASWRATVASQLAAYDRAAASVDGLPLISIDPAHPAAAAVAIRQRMSRAVRSAPDATKALLFTMMGALAQLTPEPSAFTHNYYPIPHGDYAAALNAALDELAAYVSFR